MGLLTLVVLLLLIASCGCFLLGAVAARRKAPAGIDSLSWVCLGLLFFALVPLCQTIAKISNG